MRFSENANYYLTRGVADTIPTQYVQCVINIINYDRINNIETDYLKVFKFYNHPTKNDVIQIIESQEVPEFQQTIEIKGKLSKPFTLWVISDEGSHNENITILLPSEY